MTYYPFVSKTYVGALARESGAKSPCKWVLTPIYAIRNTNSQGSDLLDKLAFSKDKLSFCGENRNRKSME